MKKLSFFIATTFILLSFIPAQLKADEEKPQVSAVAASTEVLAAESAEAAAQTARLEEISTMDLSTLSRSEKKELRKEVSEIKSKQDVYVRRHRSNRHHDGYEGNNGYHSRGTIYLVGGSGLLLVLLIILLL